MRRWRTCRFEGAATLLLLLLLLILLLLVVLLLLVLLLLVLLPLWLLLPLSLLPRLVVVVEVVHLPRHRARRRLRCLAGRGAGRMGAVRRGRSGGGLWRGRELGFGMGDE